MNNKKIIIGLSGGVDSTAAVILLKKQGYDVTGCFIDVTGHDVNGMESAKKAAEQLEIPLILRNVEKDFSQKIIDNFCREYSCGRTPNPCIICNPMIKFKVLAEEADKLGIRYISTGHYASVEHDEKTDTWYIAKATSNKDQSYMLYRLDQSVIKRLVFPLGCMSSKDEIRNIAREAGIFNSEKKDSMEICFLDDNTDFTKFIEERGFDSKLGNFVYKDGKIIGKHKGIADYTIGQRKGLGIAIGKPAFITSIDPDSGNIVIGDNQDLFRKEIFAEDCVFAGEKPDENGLEVQAKIRYAAKPEDAKVYPGENGQYRIVFVNPVRAATPGQSVVFYSGNRVSGGGFIV